MKKLNLIEFHEYQFYLKCKKCNKSPEIILNDNENIIISCNKCEIHENEKIENICNYSSEWTFEKLKDYVRIAEFNMLEYTLEYEILMDILLYYFI